MKPIASFGEIYLCTRFVDFRKQSQSLSQLVASEFDKPVGSGALFVFMGRRKDRIKLLYWDQTGFALWSKTLETQKYSWTKKLSTETSPVVDMSAEKLEWLLAGIDIFSVKKHTSVDYKYFF